MAKGRLSGILRSLFGGGRTDGDDASPAAAEDSVRPGRTVEQAEVLREDDGLFGKVYILGLAEFYDAIGGRRGRLAESLPVICDTVFSRRTGPGDGFARIGDDRYVFRLGDRDDRRSRLRAARIIEEIGTKLLGEHFITSGRFQAVLAAVGVADIADAEGDVDAEKIDAALAAARVLPPPPPAPDEPVWLRLHHVGPTAENRWAAVPGGRRGAVEWAALDYTPRKREIRWEVIEPPTRKSGGPRWEALKREKKE